MNVNSQFVVATHIMALLAGHKLYLPEYACANSEMIAESVNTNPVVIRRILSKLREANLVVSKSGPRGGSEIARHPSKIKLSEIYEAVADEGTLFHMHYGEPNRFCLVGGHIQESLKETMDNAEKSIKKILSKKSLFQIGNDILELAGIDADLPTEKISTKLRQMKQEYENSKLELQT
jgi:DNA-binding IscR family transcriptional regulator